MNIIGLGKKIGNERTTDDGSYGSDKESVIENTKTSYSTLVLSLRKQRAICSDNMQAEIAYWSKH